MKCVELSMRVMVESVDEKIKKFKQDDIIKR